MTSSFDAGPADPRWAALIRDVLHDRHVRGTILVGLDFVDADRMTELNVEHMGHDGPTDVLSFPIDGDPDQIVDRAVPPDGVAPPWMLGDIVICPEVASANAAAHAGTDDDEIALLVVHGLLHLLGMDHAEPTERAAMQARERELLDRYHGPLAHDPWTA